jgi:AraC family transcriptional regulator of adaptative response / DNA-3-methyladenine glycosylase II
VERDLLALPGIGPWTAGYIAMRALADPDAFLANDLGVRQALQRLNTTDDPRAVANMAESWRPWRAYATVHLWHTLAQPARLPKPQVLPAPRTIAA